MEFFTTDLDGITLINPDKRVRRRILETVTTAEASDYPEVYLTIRSGPVVSYRAGGYLLWELDGEVTRFMKGVSQAAAEAVWDLLIQDARAELDRLPWEAIVEGGE